VANQFRVLLSAAAYVLMETLRREGLVGTELAAAQVDTIRLKVLKIGARVVCSVRRIVVHLAGGKGGILHRPSDIHPLSFRSRSRLSQIVKIGRSMKYVG
jgi:hypothetical protein